MCVCVGCFAVLLFSNTTYKHSVVLSTRIIVLAQRSGAKRFRGRVGEEYLEWENLIFPPRKLPGAVET